MTNEIKPPIEHPSLCPYLIFSKVKTKEFTSEMKELLERAAIEHKAVLDYLKDK